LIVPLLLLTPGFAADKEKDEETLSKANLVLQDILNGKVSEFCPDLALSGSREDANGKVL
jgi:hypothetical protein